MNKNEFVSLLRTKLIERGLTEQQADRVVFNFGRQLDDEDEKMIEGVADVSEIDAFADDYIGLIQMRRRSAERAAQAKQQGQPPAPDAPKPPVSNGDAVRAREPAADKTIVVSRPETADDSPRIIAEPAPVSVQPAAVVDMTANTADVLRQPVKPAQPPARVELRRPDNADVKTRRRPDAQNGAIVSYNNGNNAANAVKEEAAEYVADEDAGYDDNAYGGGNNAYGGEPFEPEPEPTPTGKTIFIVAAIVTLPITLSFAAASLGLFVGVFAVLAGLILASIAVMITGVAGGAIISFIGIIYGITQIVKGIGPVGAYEIGVGLVIAGIIMFGGILLYNFAVRFLPWVIKKVAALFGVCVKGVKRLLILARRECYKL